MKHSSDVAKMEAEALGEAGVPEAQAEVHAEVPGGDEGVAEGLALVEAGTPAQALQERVRSALDVESLSQSAAAKEIGISAAALNQWLQGRYRGNNETVEAALERWLASRERRSAAASAMPTAPGWCRTPSAEKILSALSYGQMAGDIVCIYGGPGVGKTCTLRHYAETNPAVWIATMAPHSAPVVPALEEVAEALRLPSLIGGGARRLAASIRRKLEGSRGLLIIDEAQHLSVGALEELRSLHDATGVGLALVGNESVYGRLTGGNRSSNFAQLFSRIGVRLFLARPMVGDVRALAGAWGLRDKAAVEFLQQVAAKPGALRGATKTLLLASMAAGGGAVAAAELRAAWKNLGAQE